MMGGRGNKTEYLWDLKICKDIYFFPAFFLFSSCFIYFYFFANILFFKCSCITVMLAPVLPLCICLFVLLGRNLSSSHLFEEKKNRMYQVSYPGNQVLLSSIHIMRL